jgi:hypothetical protein
MQQVPGLAHATAGGQSVQMYATSTDARSLASSSRTMAAAS